MSSCCQPDYSTTFTSRGAVRDARRYRRRGLQWGPRRTVELLHDGSIGGETLLEVGGGIGDLQIEMLRGGIASATSVELTPTYEAVAEELLAEVGLRDRVSRTVADVATAGSEVGEADIVVAHSVICCYPDGERLVAAMASRTRGFLVVSYPRDVWFMRANAWATDVYARLRGREWRFHVHPPPLLRATAEAAGLRVVHEERNLVDHLTVFAR